MAHYMSLNSREMHHNSVLHAENDFQRPDFQIDAATTKIIYSFNPRQTSSSQEGRPTKYIGQNTRRNARSGRIQLAANKPCVVVT